MEKIGRISGIVLKMAQPLFGRVASIIAGALVTEGHAGTCGPVCQHSWSARACVAGYWFCPAQEERGKEEIS